VKLFYRLRLPFYTVIAKPTASAIIAMEKKSDFGLIGLAVMGQNLVLNVESRGFQVSVYNRTTSTMTEFIEENPGKQLVGAESLEEFVESLAVPRKIQIMVKAGGPVDAVIKSLMPLLDPGDIIIDGGNSLYTDSIKRPFNYAWRT